MSDSPSTPSRRALLRNAAALGIVAVPSYSLLSACATSGGDDNSGSNSGGTKSAANPLGVKEDAPLDVVIFNGGYGDKYATDVHEPLYKKEFPDAAVTESKTEEISTPLQPRFAGRTPPDVVDNSGSKFMDFGALVQDNQLQDLSDLFAAKSVDDPSKTVKDTLIPGT